MRYDNDGLISNPIEYEDFVNCGYERMKNMNVVVCSIARNCVGSLPNTISFLEELKTYFNSMDIVIIENDSTDDTAKILHTCPIIKSVSYNFNVPFFPGGTRSDLSVMLLSAYRNLCLEVVDAKYSNTDYVIIVDLDLQKISIDGIANSFGHTSWDVITANGRCSIRDIYYDTYAYSDIADYMSSAHPMFRQMNAISILQHIKPGFELIPIKSGFAGLGIYRTQAVLHSRYWCKLGCSEHVGLHDTIYNREYKNIFINPSMWLVR